MDHLRAGVRLLVVVRDGDRVELRGGVVPLEDRGRVLPCDRRAGLDLRPTEMRAAALAYSSLCHEVKDAASALRVAGIPVLHR